MPFVQVAFDAAVSVVNAVLSMDIVGITVAQITDLAFAAVLIGAAFKFGGQILAKLGAVFKKN